MRQSNRSKSKIVNKVQGIHHIVFRHIKENKSSYIQLAIIRIIIEILLLKIFFAYDPNVQHTPWITNVHMLLSGCVFKVEHPLLQKFSYACKGTKYLPDTTEEVCIQYRRECLVTSWNMLHFVSHFLLALIYPKCWVAIFTASGLYEIYEYFVHRCHDFTDPLYNAVGIALALGIRKLWKQM